MELESPALRTYVSANPDADMALLKFMDELKTRSDLAVQESRQQVNALREQVVQMRQNLKPTTQGAAYDHSDWVNAPSARSWHLYHVLHGQIDSDFRHPRDLAATTAALCTCCTQLIRFKHIPKLISLKVMGPQGLTNRKR